MATLSGGDKLEKTLADIARGMGGGSVEVGFLAGATYPDGTKVAQVAFWNEFGTTIAPPRPFFRTTISRESPGWGVLMAKAAKHYDYDAPTVLKFMGTKIAEQVTDSILGWQNPRNADSTIAIKGFDKPLIHSGDMSRGVDYEVKE
jgi:hypothetical protein